MISDVDTFSTIIPVIFIARPWKLVVKHIINEILKILLALRAHRGSRKRELILQSSLLYRIFLNIFYNFGQVPPHWLATFGFITMKTIVSYILNFHPYLVWCPWYKPWDEFLKDCVAKAKNVSIISFMVFSDFLVTSAKVRNPNLSIRHIREWKIYRTTFLISSKSERRNFLKVI